MPPSFETGAPASRGELSQALDRLVAEGTTYLAGFADEEFFSPQDEAWSPARHVAHLQRSSDPLATALGLPRWVIRLRFGHAAGPSRSFEQVVAAYRAALAGGGTAGRFTPADEPLPADPSSRRNELINGWARATVGVQDGLSRWDEDALDRYCLPHPLLGRLTVREMLCFTVYHTAHHLRRVAERRRSRTVA